MTFKKRSCIYISQTTSSIVLSTIDCLTQQYKKRAEHVSYIKSGLNTIIYSIIALFFLFYNIN